MRVARLLRLFRIGRLLKFFKALQLIVYSIFHTLKSVIWSMVLLLIIIYVFGILLTQVVSDHAVTVEIGGSWPDAMTAETHDLLLLHWGTLGDAMVSLFKAISGGVSWHEIVF